MTLPPMPSIRRRGASWRAEIYKDGRRESAIFPSALSGAKITAMKTAGGF